jgi:hypothetical protein
MLLSTEEIEGLCERTPGLEAWVLREATAGPHEVSHLLHFGGPAA